ncbi:MAG TPA: YqaA family protein [Candidatus Cybelea sp.]|nr:YqaA family protein [Candidatus Cybelea sp.]
MWKRLYDWTLTKARHPQAPWWLAFFSFIESSVFPTPPDPILALMVLADRRHVIRLVLNCTASSVLGGLLGYAIGYYLFESVGRPVLELTHAMGQFATVQNCFNHYGALIILIKGLTPIPYKLITITAGVTKLDLATFMLASLASRGARFAIVGAAMYWVDSPIGVFLRKHLRVAAMLALVLLVTVGVYILYAPGGPVCG